MTYLPHTDADRQAMLAAIGVAQIADLFGDVPADQRFPALDLPAPLSELEILRELQALSESNATVDHNLCFLGAGAYDHFIPSVVKHLVGRAEFYTAYTPYQPEVSQGTLQSIFEYQSMICALTGLDVANASHYDGATATAEAVIMALGVSRGKRNQVLLAPAIHPEYRAVVRTYTQGLGVTCRGDESLTVDLDDLTAMVDDHTACVIVQNPDFFGRLLDVRKLRALADAAHAHKALFVTVVNPISLGLFRPPGDYGADVAVGEGQPLGNPLSYGGPYLGFFACRQEYVHKMAGRLVGQTTDTQGRRGFVLTLTAREQHIRREKASSNICSNEALCALAAGVYLAALGKTGLRAVAEVCYHRAHYAAARIAAVRGFSLADQSPFFHEFIVRCPVPPGELNQFLWENFGIIGGYELGFDYPMLENCLLFCVTEMNSRRDIDLLVSALEEVLP